MNHAFLLILISGLCTATAAFLFTKWFRQPETASQRSRQLDGLRGILACCVIAHHSYYNFTWREGGAWGAKSMVIINLGAVAVSLFFMLSAYLHIAKIRHSPDINWREFYWGRAKRIYPLYLAVFALVALITVWFKPLNSQNIDEFLLFSWKWVLFQNVGFEGFQSHLIIAGVQWTLVYEWAVYAVLPLIHMIYHRKITLQPMAWVAIAISYWVMMYHTQTRYLWIFVLAIPAAVFAKPIQAALQRLPWLCHLLLIALTIYIFGYTVAYSWEQRILLAVLFAFIANGYAYANLLNYRGLIKLGDISYAIYLVHGMVLFMWFGVWKMFAFKQGNFVGYLWHLPLVFAASFALAWLGNRYVEMPFWKRK